MRAMIILALVVTSSFTSAVVVRSAEQPGKAKSAGVDHPAETQGTRVTGQLTHIEGWHYTIKDTTGQEVSFGVTSDTKDSDQVKEGDLSSQSLGKTG